MFEAVVPAGLVESDCKHGITGEEMDQRQVSRMAALGAKRSFALRSTSRVVLTSPRSFSIGGIVRKRQFETTFLVAENAALVDERGGRQCPSFPRHC